MKWKMLALVLSAMLWITGTASGAETINLKVLYAGNPDSDRAKDFMAFLQKQFTKATLTDFTKFNENEAKDYDVVIFDWSSIYPRDKDGKITKGGGGIKSPSAPVLSPNFARPTVLIGAAGGDVAGSRNIKINWL